MNVPKGIVNVSGVACHFTSALQLLLHSMPELKEALLLIAATSTREDIPEWILQLSFLCKDLLEDDSTNSTANATLLFDAFSKSELIDPHELGDAATTVRVVLYTIQHQAFLPALATLLKTYLNGSVQQTMIGEQNDSASVVRRTKVTSKSMACPFVVHVNEDCSSLAEALEQATTQPQVVHGLDWNQISGWNETTIEGGAYEFDDDDFSMTTTKTIRITSLPYYLVLHLQRALYNEDTRRIQLLVADMDIPITLEMSPFMARLESQEFSFMELNGAILHVQDVQSNVDDDEKEGGHYVALVRTSPHDWFLLDDETGTRVGSDCISALLSTGRSDISDEKTYCATVLLYSKQTTKLTDNDSVSLLLDELRHELLERRKEQPNSPRDLIGKRLRLRWKSGRYFAGIVSSYNEESGKHVVRYDDGDVREYNLEKKTIEWIDSSL